MTIAFLAVVALAVLVDILATRPRRAAAAAPPTPERINVDLRRRS